MAETRARDVARTFGQAIEQNTLTATGSLGVTGLSVYATIDDLPLSGIDAGTQALVTATNTLYINNGVGWFKIALINNAPYFSDSGTPESTYSLSSQGTATTITLIAVDSEGLPITYSAVADSDFGGLASISQDSSVFTITPFSEDSATTSSGTVTFKATDGVNIASALSTFTLQFSVTNSSHTLLLAKASGNDGTNAITDESSNGYTLTKSGDVKRSAFSPYRDAGYSYYFDGSGDYLRADTAIDFASSTTSNFTIEFWSNFVGTPSAYQAIIGINTASSGTNQLLIGVSSSGIWQWTWNGTDYNSSQFDAGSWNHVAATYDGTNVKFYLNGVLDYTVSSAAASTALASCTFLIGAEADAANAGTLGNYFEGYLTDVRISNTVIYTDDFTPPSRVSASTGVTEFLTCHLPYLVDGSENEHAITLSGNVKVEPFTPFDNSAAYSASNNGSSLYFDGSGDYLTIADTNSRVSTGSYTVEGWFYLEGLPSTRSQHATLHTQYFPSSSYGGRYLIYVSSNDNAFTYWVGADGSTTHSNIIKTHQWYHFAAVRNGTSCTLYLNGKGETDGVVYDTSIYQENPQVGAEPNNGTYLLGYIADWHLTKGTAKYTSDFTPPTSPISNSSATTSIANVSTPNLYDASQTHTITLAGNTSSSTGQTKYASSSIYFDGTGDYIDCGDKLIPSGQYDDWTVETWFNVPSNTTRYDLISQYAAAQSGRMTINTQTDGTVEFFQNGLSPAPLSSTDMITANTWHHLAITNSGGTRTLFLDGVNQGTATGSQSIYTGVNTYIGYASGQSYTSGYIEDLRITRGLARYPFIPAKETLTGGNVLIAHASSATDGGSGGATVTLNGNAAVSTFAPKQGMYSIYFDGTDDSASLSSDQTNQDLTSGDFTVETWVYTTTASRRTIASTRPSSGNYGWVLTLDASGQPWWYFTGGSSVTSSTALTTNKWHHIVVTRSSNTLTIFLDGSKITSATVSNGGATSQAMYLGNDTYAGSYDWSGYISNFKITKGSVLYTDSFTPPTAELQG